MTITYRDTKGSDLIPSEVDANFRHVLDSSNSTFAQSGTRPPSGTVAAELWDSHVNVRSSTYGALGDGTTDDRTALFNANAITEEKYVPKGTYLVNSALTLSGVWRFADGAQIKPASGIAITLDSTFVGYSGDVQMIDTSAGGTKTASAGSTQKVVGTSSAGQSKNQINGYAGNSIATGAGSCIIAGGGNASGNDNAIGASDYITISGGYDNVVEACIASTIAGGAHHNVTGTANHAVIGGGSFNDIDAGNYGTIAGGTGHTVSASEATICGGTTNTVTGQYSFIGGGTTNSAASLRGVIGGGSLNSIGDVSNGATIAGGTDNDLANAAGATISGGELCKITPGTSSFGNYSTIGGGLSNQIATTLQSQYSVITGGRLNTISGGDYAVILGGRDNTVSAAMASAIGRDASATLIGQQVVAVEKFSAQGDAQTSVLVAKRQTTDNTPTELRLGSGLGRMSIPADTTWCFDILVAARRTDANDESAAYRLVGCIDRNVNVTALVGAVTKTDIAEDTAGWDVAATADDTNDCLTITVTGENAKTINWVARVILVQVTG